MMFYGSYFGDWDRENDLLRAPLATPTYTLTCAWAGRPHWQFHHMALGETIGFSARLAQNNDGMLYKTSYAKFLHIALMGDPTLRMHPVAPPATLKISTNSSGHRLLGWTPSADDIAGYAVYGSTEVEGPFTRLQSGLLSTNVFIDVAGASQVYMVRAVKLEVSASGSYFNPSQGIFEDLTGDFEAPALRLHRTNDTLELSWPASAIGFQLESAATLSFPDWQPDNNPIQTTNAVNLVVEPFQSIPRFFRLVRH